MKNPTMSAVLSLGFAGLGQIYNGDWLRGGAWLLVTGGSWIGSLGGFGLPLVLHLIAAYTAYNRAHEINTFRSAS